MSSYKCIYCGRPIDPTTETTCSCWKQEEVVDVYKGFTVGPYRKGQDPVRLGLVGNKSRREGEYLCSRPPFPDEE